MSTRLMSILAEATEKATESCPISGCFANWDTIVVVGTAILVIGIFLRQRKIAQNQVELAQLIKALLERK